MLCIDKTRCDMAIWQVPITFIPQKCDENSNAVLLNSLNELSAVLPEEKSWCSSIRQYGSIDSTCLEIFFENGAPEVSLRIDMRSVTEKELSAIADFAGENGYKAKCADEVFAPTLENFIRIISESDANRFVNDPCGFLGELS